MARRTFWCLSVTLAILSYVVLAVLIAFGVQALRSLSHAKHFEILFHRHKDYNCSDSNEDVAGNEIGHPVVVIVKEESEKLPGDDIQLRDMADLSWQASVTPGQTEKHERVLVAVASIR